MAGRQTRFINPDAAALKKYDTMTRVFVPKPFDKVVELLNCETTAPLLEWCYDVSPMAWPISGSWHPGRSNRPLTAPVCLRGKQGASGSVFRRYETNKPT